MTSTPSSSPLNQPKSIINRSFSTTHQNGSSTSQKRPLCKTATSNGTTVTKPNSETFVSGHHQGSSSAEHAADLTNVGNNGASCPVASSPPKKKRRRQSAFRIRVGCLVALRYRSTGNAVHLNEQLGADRSDGDGCGVVVPPSQESAVVDTWVDPTPGVDESYLLLGRRVRCCFPKSVLNRDDPATSRMVEGEIVGLLLQDSSATENYVPVELLIDNTALQPYLERVDQEVDVSQLTEKDRKRHKYEEIIKGGKHKIIVRVNLVATPSSTTTAMNTNGAGTGDVSNNSDDQPLVCKWVLRKRVESSELKGEKNGTEKHVTKQYVGNKHDSDSQQEQNWRWLARVKAAHINITNSDTRANPFIFGEVLHMMPKTDGSTLALVTLKEIGVSIHTPRGQTPLQGGTVFLDLKTPRHFEVPIEELVIVSRKIVRGEAAGAFKHNEDALAVIHRVYSCDTNSWKTTTKSDGQNEEASEVTTLVCHRCGMEGLNMFKDHMACTPNAISCSDCLTEAKVFGKSGTFLKSCRCQPCQLHHAGALNRVFEQSRTVMTNGSELQECNLCCLRCKSGVSCKSCGVMIHKRCAKWMRLVDSDEGEVCRVCRAMLAKANENVRALSTPEDIFALAISRVREMRFSDFDLPVSYLTIHTVQASSGKPITSIKPRGTNAPRKSTGSTRTVQKKRVRASSTSTMSGSKKKQKGGGNDTQESVRAGKFKPVCSRLLPYDPIQRRFEGISKHQIASFSSRSKDSSNYKDVIRNLRGTIQKQDEKKLASRAARANQRRLMKDVVAFGSTSLSLDALAGRESHLRFDRSGIHAWGVFADQDIREGELIVEYRGVIIGNAVAEKREKEYEKAKIGSDYMFRIDGNSVCDATKHGNVARFINASCDPNCYTQIISINGVKRIVIYAKTDIQAGQELCYDYKFPLEYNEEKRIPCYCGSKDCRGFMNWDKRYIALPLPGDSIAPQAPHHVLKSAAYTSPAITSPPPADAK